MTLTLAPALRPRLELRPTASLVAFAQLLATSAPDLDRMVERELAENPALERADRFRAQPHEAHVPEPVDVPATLTRLALDARVSLPRADHAALELVLGSLDDHGFLTVEPEAIARAAHRPLNRVRAVIA